MRKKIKNLFIIFLLAAAGGFLSFSFLSNAQLMNLGELNTLGGESFFITLIPTDFPGPGQNVIARLGGFSFDIERAEITWIRNERVVQRGLGLKEYSFTTGKIGEQENLRVVAIANGGQRHEVSLTIYISDIDLLWQADTSAPLWYKGRTLASPRSSVTVVAFPNLTSGVRKIPSSQLIFRWSLDDDFKQNLSGAGIQNFTFTTDIVSDIIHEIEVEISNLDESIKTRKTLQVQMKEPEIVIYEEHPLEGPLINFGLQRGVSYSMFAGEVREFRAMPFFFSQTGGRPSFSYKWIIDGEQAREGDNPHILRLTATPGSRGVSAVEVIIENATNILQQIKESFDVNVL